MTDAKYCLACKTENLHGLIFFMHNTKDIPCFKTVYYFTSMYDNFFFFAFSRAKFLLAHKSSLTKPFHLVQLNAMTECSHLWKNNPHIDWPSARPSAVWLAKGGGWKSKIRDKNKRDGGTASQRSSYLPASLLPVFQIHTQLSISCSSLCHISDFLSSQTARTMMQLGCEESFTHTQSQHLNNCYVTTNFLPYPACTK